MASTQELLKSLDADTWRQSNPFPQDIKVACEVLLNPYSRYDERCVAISGWLAKHQPCVFGQVAARTDGLFISIIDERDIARGDEFLREKLIGDRRSWKQWSLDGKGRHGFLLVVLSPDLHYAFPNQSMKRFAEHVRQLFSGDSKADAAGNDMAYDWLYLRNPNSELYHKFRVILDFFASAGDGRWWHDHRFPGGIAFTFNSLGHMTRTREWYEKNTTPVEWATRMAMLTISNAHQHPVYGKATWLLDLEKGLPFKAVKCPFANLETLPSKIKGKDWTTYQGFHHTDHSIRGEFFDGREKPDRVRGAYLLDFSYIAGGADGENKELMDGVAVDEKFVDCDLGSVDSWRFAKPAKPIEEETPIGAGSGTSRQHVRPAEEDAKINAALAECKKWLESDMSL